MSFNRVKESIFPSCNFRKKTFDWPNALPFYSPSLYKWLAYSVIMKYHSVQLLNVNTFILHGFLSAFSSSKCVTFAPSFITDRQG